MRRERCGERQCAGRAVHKLFVRVSLCVRERERERERGEERASLSYQFGVVVRVLGFR